MSGAVARLVKRLHGPAATYLIAAVLARVGSYVLIPLYTRHFTVEEYGTFALAQTLVMLFQTCISALFLTGVSRVYFDARDPERGFAAAGSVSRAMAFVTLLSGGLALLVITLAPAWPLFDPQESACIVIGGVGSTLASLPYMLMRLRARPVAASVFNFLQFTTTAASGIALVAGLGRGLRGGIEAIAVSGALNGVVALIFLFVTFRTPVDREAVRVGMRFALPLAPTSLVSFVSSIADRWMLKLVGLDAAVGAYSLSSQLMTPALMVQNAWNEAESVRIGEVYRADGVQGVYRSRRAVLKGYLLASVIPAVGLLIVTPIIALIIGKAFVSALVLMPLVGLALVLEATFFPDMYVLYYASSTRAISISSVARALLNVGVTLVLLPVGGIFAVVAGRIVSTIGAVAIVHLAVRRLPQTQAPTGESA